MRALTWTVGSWLVRIHQSGGSQSVTFDEQATISNRVYAIKQQGDSWVVIRAVNDVDDRYRVFDSMDGAKRQAEEWEQAVCHAAALRLRCRVTRSRGLIPWAGSFSGSRKRPQTLPQFQRPHQQVQTQVKPCAAAGGSC
jgi:hypothetical protein